MVITCVGGGQDHWCRGWAGRALRRLSPPATLGRTGTWLGCAHLAVGGANDRPHRAMSRGTPAGRRAQGRGRRRAHRPTGWPPARRPRQWPARRPARSAPGSLAMPVCRGSHPSRTPLRRGSPAPRPPAQHVDARGPATPVSQASPHPAHGPAHGHDSRARRLELRGDGLPLHRRRRAGRAAGVTCR